MFPIALLFLLLTASPRGAVMSFIVKFFPRRCRSVAARTFPVSISVPVFFSVPISFTFTFTFTFTIAIPIPLSVSVSVSVTVSVTVTVTVPVPLAVSITILFASTLSTAAKFTWYLSPISNTRIINFRCFISDWRS